MGHIVELDAKDPIIDDAKDVWKVVIPECKESSLQSAICSSGKLAMWYLVNASEQMKVYDFDSNHLRDIALPDLGTVTEVAAEHDKDEMFYAFNSFTDPRSVYRLDMKTYKTETIA